MPNQFDSLVKVALRTIPFLLHFSHVLHAARAFFRVMLLLLLALCVLLFN